MIFEQVATGGCQSYLIGCGETCTAAVIDPEVRQINRYQALATQHGVRIRYVIDTHTHADHFSGSKQLSQILGVPVVAHQLSPSPYVTMRVDEAFCSLPNSFPEHLRQFRLAFAAVIDGSNNGRRLIGCWFGPNLRIE